MILSEVHLLNVKGVLKAKVERVLLVKDDVKKKREAVNEGDVGDRRIVLIKL